MWAETQPKKNQSEDERSKSGGTPAASVDALMSIAHGVGVGVGVDKSSVGGVLVHMPHVRMRSRRLDALSVCHRVAIL